MFFIHSQHEPCLVVKILVVSLEWDRGCEISVKGLVEKMAIVPDKGVVGFSPEVRGGKGGHLEGAFIDGMGFWLI